MTDFVDRTGVKPLVPPLARGAPLLLLCFFGLAYAALAIPATLIPHSGLLNVLGIPTGNDFLAFYSAALLVSGHSAADVYDLGQLLPLQDALSGTPTHLPFSYPPHFLLLIAPLATMPYLPALYVWIVATTAPFIFIARKLSGLWLPVIALAPPLIQNAIDGQNGALTASLFAGGLLLLGGRRPALAGIAFGLMSFKPQVFLLLPICLIAARQYRALAALAATCAVLFLASLGLFGFEAWRRFAENLPLQMSLAIDGQLPVARCPTVFVLVLHATGNLAFADIAQAASTLAAWALVAWSWRRSEAPFIRALSFCVAMPLSTPYLLEYDLAVWTLPAAMLLMRLWRGGGAAPDWAALAILWLSPPAIMVMGRMGLHLSALLVLALIPYAIWSLRREAPAGPNLGSAEGLKAAI